MRGLKFLIYYLVVEKCCLLGVGVDYIFILESWGVYGMFLIGLYWYSDDEVV